LLSEESLFEQIRISRRRSEPFTCFKACPVRLRLGTSPRREQPVVSEPVLSVVEGVEPSRRSEAPRLYSRGIFTYFGKTRRSLPSPKFILRSATENGRLLPAVTLWAGGTRRQAYPPSTRLRRVTLFAFPSSVAVFLLLRRTGIHVLTPVAFCEGG